MSFGPHCVCLLLKEQNLMQYLMPETPLIIPNRHVCCEGTSRRSLMSEDSHCRGESDNFTAAHRTSCKPNVQPLSHACKLSCSSCSKDKSQEQDHAEGSVRVPAICYQRPVRLSAGTSLDPELSPQTSVVGPQQQSIPRRYAAST